MDSDDYSYHQAEFDDTASDASTDSYSDGGISLEEEDWESPSSPWSTADVSTPADINTPNHPTHALDGLNDRDGRPAAPSSAQPADTKSTSRVPLPPRAPTWPSARTCTYAYISLAAPEVAKTVRVHTTERSSSQSSDRSAPTTTTTMAQKRPGPGDGHGIRIPSEKQIRNASNHPPSDAANRAFKETVRQKVTELQRVRAALQRDAFRRLGKENRIVSRASAVVVEGCGGRTAAVGTVSDRQFANFR